MHFRPILLMATLLALVACAGPHLPYGYKNEYEIAGRQSGALRWDAATEAYVRTIESEAMREKLGLDKPIRVLQARMPYMSRQAIDDGTSGKVVVFFTITEQGLVENIATTGSTQSSLDKSVREAIQEWRFEPLIRGGNTVRQRANMTFNFKVAQ